MKSRTAIRTVFGTLVTTALIAAGGCATGVRSDGGYTEDAYVGDVETASGMDMAASELWIAEEWAADAAAQEAGDLNPNSSASDVAGPSEHIIVTGSIDILTDRPEENADKFAEAVAELDGFIENRWQHAYGRGTSVTVTARIPVDSYSEAEATAANLGKVESRSMDRADVGAAVADLQARKEALEDSLGRLKVLMDEAETVSELLEAEQMRTERQAELDGLVAQLDWYEDQVAMSTLSATFSTVPDVDGAFSWARAFEMLRTSVEYVGYALVVIVPWTVVIAGVIILVRGVRRRRRKGAAVNQRESESPGDPAVED